MAWIQDVIVEIPTGDSKIMIFMGNELNEIKIHYIYPTGNHHTQLVSSSQLPYQIYNTEGKTFIYKVNSTFYTGCLGNPDDGNGQKSPS